MCASRPSSNAIFTRSQKIPPDPLRRRANHCTTASRRLARRSGARCWRFNLQGSSSQSDAARGKRGGYRLLYYLQTPTEIILVTIYSKSEQSDISAEEIRRILKEVG
jgi:hypothetical protein